jgi:hypothetical protein
MNLFRRPRNTVEPAEVTFDPSLPSQQRRQPLCLEPISMNAEQKSLLEEPIHPRVERILQEIYDDRAAAERALNARRIIEFPISDSGEPYVIQDENGFWRIVPGTVPVKSARLADRV